MSLNLRAGGDSKTSAITGIQPALSALLGDLTHLGGVVLTADTMRAALTWSTQSIRTHEEYDHNTGTGEHGPTGRHLASVSMRITVRDFSLLADVSGVVTGRDVIDVESVSWSVDDDNRQWALVRADAIGAALRKGRDYAAALGGVVTSIDHVADAGLLGIDNLNRRGRVSANFSMTSMESDGGRADLSLDPVPQILSATIEARFTATVTIPPSAYLPPVSTSGSAQSEPT